MSVFNQSDCVRKPVTRQVNFSTSAGWRDSQSCRVIASGVDFMNIEYLLARRTNGANPSKIWSQIGCVNQDKLAWLIERMPYSEFLQTAYWFGVATKRKTDMGMRCQVCNETGTLNVHHRTYDIHGREHQNLNDLCVLCEFCHGLFHGHLEQTPGRFRSQRGRAKLKRDTVIPHSDSDVIVPDGEIIVLTRDLIDACRANGTFTNATIRAFGLAKKDLLKGWTGRLIGKQMTRDAYRAACEGKFHYRTGRLE